MQQEGCACREEFHEKQRGKEIGISGYQLLLVRGGGIGGMSEGTDGLVDQNRLWDRREQKEGAKRITQEVQAEPPSYCSKRMFRRSPLLMRTMQSFSWKRPCCSALPPLSRRLTNKPRVLKRSETRVSEAGRHPWAKPGEEQEF